LQLFLDILTGITLPILGLVALGYGVQKRYAFDIPTLTRLQIYVLGPVALIWFPSAAKLPLSTSWPVVWFSLALSTFLFGFGWVVAKSLNMNRNVSGLMALAAMFSNSGNYGIPLIQLTFPDDYLLYQTVIFSLHSIFVVPLMLIALSGSGVGHFSIWRTLFGTPLLPAAALGFVLKGFDVTLPQVLAIPLRLTSQAFTPMALLLLGIQLAAIQIRVERTPVVVGLILRMAVAPASAWLLATLLGFPPNLIAFLVVSASVPAGVLIAIFASEFNVEPELASMLVFISTAISALAVTGWIYAVRYAGLQ
jgi:malate permease and related proteins